MMCLCRGKGWVPSPTIDGFPRRCLLCLGQGTVTWWHLRQHGEFPRTNGVQRCSMKKLATIVECVERAERLFRLQQDATERVYHRANMEANFVTWARLERLFLGGGFFATLTRKSSEVGGNRV
jgi:hypothetical protein